MTHVPQAEFTLADSDVWDAEAGLDQSNQLTYPLVGWGETLWNSYDPETNVEFICENLEGWAGLPAGDPSSVNREFDYGSFSGRGWYGPRLLTLTGVLLARNRDDLQRALHKVRATHWRTLMETAVLAVAEVDGEKRLGVRTTTSTMNASYLTPTCLRVEVELQAAWPIKRGLPQTGITDVPGGAVGRHYPRPTADNGFRLYGPLGSSGNLVLTNVGNAPVRPQFEITGPVVNPSIWHAQQNRHLGLVIELGEQDRLWLDADTHAIVLNGVANRRSVLATDSAWFDLTPGLNTIQYRPSSGEGTLQVFFNAGWW